MWHRLTSEMDEKCLHWRVIAEAAVLLIEAEMCGVKVDDERWRPARELAQNVIGIAHIWLGQSLRR